MERVPREIWYDIVEEIFTTSETMHRALALSETCRFMHDCVFRYLDLCADSERVVERLKTTASEAYLHRKAKALVDFATTRPTPYSALRCLRWLFCPASIPVRYDGSVLSEGSEPTAVVIPTATASGKLWRVLTDDGAALSSFDITDECSVGAPYTSAPGLCMSRSDVPNFPRFRADARFYTTEHIPSANDARHQMCIWIDRNGQQGIRKHQIRILSRFSTRSYSVQAFCAPRDLPASVVESTCRDCDPRRLFRSIRACTHAPDVRLHNWLRVLGVSPSVCRIVDSPIYMYMPPRSDWKHGTTSAGWFWSSGHDGRPIDVHHVSPAPYRVQPDVYETRRSVGEFLQRSPSRIDALAHDMDPLHDDMHRTLVRHLREWQARYRSSGDDTDRTDKRPRTQ